jgi:threonine synthase
MRKDFVAAAASEDDVADTIRRLKAEHDYLVDPHTACGVVAAERVLKGEAPQVVLSTASPAKFPDAMQEITGERPALPERLAGLLTDKERFETIDNDLVAIERHVEARTHATIKERG